MTVTVARPSAHVLAVDVADETVLYDPVRDSLHLLDPVGAAVWAELGGGTSLERVSQLLAARARADVRRVAHDVRALVAGLRDAGVVDAPRGTAPATGLHTEPADPPASWADAGPAPRLRTPFTTDAFRALGHRFVVESNLPGLCAWLDTVLVDLHDTSTTAPGRYAVLDLGPEHGDDRYLLVFDGERVARAGWLPRVLDLLLWHVNTQAAARSSADHVLLHAAAAARDGAAVLMPAGSTHGKSTTVAGLVRAGWQYVTDEIVALDPSSLDVVGYPRPICLDRGSWSVLPDLRPRHPELVTGQWQVPASTIRPDAVRRTATPSVIVSPRYVAGADTRLDRMTPGEAVLALANSTLAFHDDPGRNLRTLARLATAAPGFRLTIGTLDHALDLVEVALMTGR